MTKTEKILQETHDAIINLNAQMKPILKTFEPDGKFDKIVTKVIENESRSKVNKKMIWGSIIYIGGIVSPVIVFLIIRRLFRG